MLGVAASSGSDFECRGLVLADRVAVEVAWLAHLAAHGDRPGSTGELSGYDGVGPNVGLCSFRLLSPLVVVNLH